MRRFLRENSLSVFFLALLLVTVVGQSFVGQHQYNLRQRGSPESKPVGAPHSETGSAD